MAFTRPIVYVYQELATITVTPGTPDLNCVLVGPCFHIEDYPTDSSDIQLTVDFVVTGKTKDSACVAGGTSGARPDPNIDFSVQPEPPNHTAGGTLDSDSVDLIFASVLIELDKNTDGTTTAETNVFTSSGVDFTLAAVGDRLVITDASNPGDDDHTILKIINTIVDANTVTVTKLFTDADLTKIGGAGVPHKTVSTALFRLEHALTDAVHFDTDDTDYLTVSGNEITIKTGPTGVLAVYNATSYLVNWAELFIGYRELRTDLEDVLTLDSASEITTNLGVNDERNPLAAGAAVTFANTGTPIQVFGVITDNLAGHSNARDKISSRDDIYAIVPLTDSITAATWVNSIIAMWKTHVTEFEAYDKAKFRIVLGSYPDLPEEKAAVPPSTEGNTLEDPSGSAEVDVFVDPATATDFITAGVGSDHLLDIAHCAESTLLSADNQKHLFSSSGYHGAHELLGAIGKKRLRVAAGTGFNPTVPDNVANYIVRGKIKKGEGVATTAIKADETGCSWGPDGGTKGRITKGTTGVFSNVVIGDVAHVSGDVTTASHNDGFYVINVDVSGNYIDVELAEQTAGTVEVQVYRPVDSSNLCSLVATTGTIQSSGGSDLANVAVGDLCVVLQSATAANIGMWTVQNKTADDIITIGDPLTALVDDGAAGTGGINVVFFRGVAGNPDTTTYTRKRLTRLKDVGGVAFIGNVDPGDSIEIPYPADTDPAKWDTTTTTWLVDTVVSDELLDAALDTLEELAPDAFIAGYSNDDMAYRVTISLDKTAQVAELNTIPEGLKSHRVVMAWPNECYVSDLTNNLTGQRSRHHGQYLACAIGGMISGLPSHQGFTFISIGGIEQIFNSNFYFTDAQITSLSDDGWYVFLQDSSTSSPYCAFEVTTDTDAYETGELMAVKNFDYVALYFKEVLHGFLGRYNIIPETLEMIQDAFYNGVEFLQLRTFPRIGAPLIDASLDLIEQLTSEVDRVEMYASLDLPKVLNKIGLHLQA